MAIRLIYNHIAHHARHSGYDQLARYVEAEPYETGLLSRLFRKLPRRFMQGLPALRTPWYGEQALRRELEICGRSLLPRRTLYHFFYAENDLRLSSRFWLRCNNRIVATFHQPPAYLEDHVADKRYIRGLDAAVVVSEHQVEYMTRFLPVERVFHVPHGVDTSYWAPDPAVEKTEEPTFLFVGFWLRDIEMFAATVRRAAESGLGARFRVVTPAEHRALFEGLPDTEVLSGITDEALRDEYRRAHATFLPLELATANNAILETLSCGSAVVTTDSGGVVEYIDDRCGFVVPRGDVDAALGALRSIVDDRGRMQRMGAWGRQRAEEFAWERVGAQMQDVYRLVLAGRRALRRQRGGDAG